MKSALKPPSECRPPTHRRDYQLRSAPLCAAWFGGFLPLPVRQGQAEATKLILSLISM